MDQSIPPDSPHHTVLDMLRRSAGEFPDTSYVNDRNDDDWSGLTYRQVLNESRCVAAGLLDAGIQARDRVAFMSTPEGASFVNPRNLEAVASCLPF